VSEAGVLVGGGRWRDAMPIADAMTLTGSSQPSQETPGGAPGRGAGRLAARTTEGRA